MNPEQTSMNDYKIDVGEVEELQNLKDTDALEKIYAKAKSAVVNGAKVNLVRKGEQFDEMDTLEGLDVWWMGVMKYL